MHFSHLARVVVNVSGDAHGDELSFWQGALGLPLQPFAKFPEFHGAELHHKEFGLLVQKTGEGVPAFHVDIHTDNREAEVARLIALGAEVVDGSQQFWTVMRDPAGLVFCVVQVPDGVLTDANAARWE